MAQQARKILIAMDGSKYSDYAFDWFMRYFYKDKDDVLLAYCVEPPTGLSMFCRRKSKGVVETETTPAAPVAPGQDANAVAKVPQEDEDESTVLLIRLQSKISSAGVKGSVLRLSGKPGEALVKASEENKVDIIVTGTRGSGFFKRSTMGSVSQHIVNNASVPVLVVRV
ncbi:universal stress protein YxiE-like [Physella acuta]|uniref:universal stress protein YxiE-like n=1 Tax=Physella acuta TaxID=109671 RepID=UPI0027DABD32|nr:universal stress protein YxiE-like [Physella acuta]XP_059179516.1 universal stress protein YxiE-like [Physella acuta]XP_059179517.1 universal stress protein YxiE-like [Physella acuta]